MNLKYPRDLLKWRHYSYSSSLPKPKQMALQRYDGLGQLKKTKNDDSSQCQFGGLTIDMLFYGESPEHHLSKQIPNIDYEIEVVQTEEEACYGLQPYIKISAQQLASIVKDDNLIFLDGNCLYEKEIKTLECNGGVSTSSNNKLNYTKPYISHHAKKRSLILKAASAVA